jgi:hypothetical protein
LTPGKVVFVGTVTEATDVSDAANDGFGKRQFVFHVQEAFSGVTGSRVEVFSDMTSCGVDFASGESYLVDGRKGDDGEITVHACSFTELASEVPDEIRILRRMAGGKASLGIFGQLIEFRKPGEHSRSTDPDLWQPLSDVPVVISSATVTRQTTTDASGRFSVWDLPQGVYRVRIDLKPPFRLVGDSPSFHQQFADPERIELQDCPARLSFLAMSWGG